MSWDAFRMPAQQTGQPTAAVRARIWVLLCGLDLVLVIIRQPIVVRIPWPIWGRVCLRDDLKPGTSGRLEELF